jgi:hypothetical protein
MSAEEDKALIRRYYNELNRKSFMAYDELVAPNVQGPTVGRVAPTAGHSRPKEWTCTVSAAAKSSRSVTAPTV